ncbi:MAG TPA: HD domain-containing phosphohydrolase [Burkholderiales bacterium]|jgi:HD-GYP domain-containing protein (c-di-GMP phosphodiesterase class II)|nr:HD domain-containing phosphohydrolase [Burkholderiales bacterium]
MGEVLSQQAKAADPASSAAQSLETRVAELELLYRVGISLSAEQDKDRLVEMILLEAKQLCNADGGTLYLRNESDQLEFEILRNDTLRFAQGGTTGVPITLPPIPILIDGVPNRRNVATFAAHSGKTVNIADAYHAEGFDFSGTKAFDQRSGYRSQSFLTCPMVNNEGRVIGVLQLINARDAAGTVIAFAPERQRIVEALASQAGIALDNQLLLVAQKKLLESFIQLMASAIDAKSPYTGEHCKRVPVITKMLAQAACEVKQGPLAGFDLTPDEWYELHIAAWLHDCGKVITPVHVMDKATKLESIRDGIATLRERYEILKRDLEIAHLRGEFDAAERDRRHAALDEELAFLEAANVGGEFLPPEKQQRIRDIGKRTYQRRGRDEPLLTEDEVENLCISRGTLTEKERLVINGHMVQTIKMLEQLPFPRNLRRVPEYAGGHHEKRDGTGYPKGIFADEMSIPARIMVIADVFEALTSSDRPYKKPKSLSETMKIMGFLKRDNHLDPDLFDLFVQSGMYRKCGELFLKPEQLDAVDEAALLALKPKPFDLAATEVRALRWKDFLPQYRGL